MTFSTVPSSAYDPAMTARVLVLAALVLLCLTGCQAAPAGAFTRTVARADVATWTRQAIRAASSPRASTKSDAFETCRSDAGFFTTSYEWRTITNLAVPLSDQKAATDAIEHSFEASGWAVSRPTGIVAIAGPKGSKLKGLITIQTAGDSQLAIAVMSPCYS
jgi:hypothetical protein